MRSRRAEPPSTVAQSRSRNYCKLGSFRKTRLTSQGLFENGGAEGVRQLEGKSIY